jgi:capsular polysaccharide export protein
VACIGIQQYVVIAKSIAKSIAVLEGSAVITGGISAFEGKQVLMLQGPLGPFFRRLARDLEHVGATVHKIDFNGGDWLFSRSGSISFRGTLEHWPAFLEQVLIDLQIDSVLLFGDCRPIHVAAHAVASRLGVEIGVFEEGYVRPNFITFEQIGVNGHSRIPRTPEFYLDGSDGDISATMPIGNTYWFAVFWAILYYLAAALLSPLYLRYEHHRILSLREAWPWAHSAWRKIKYSMIEKGVQEELVQKYAKQYFLLPLQVHNDSQIHVHSLFDSVTDFIENVLPSFALSAPSETLLVIKHHPMDRGYHDYTRLISRLASEHGIEDRVRYIHDQHLPTLLDNARGVVVVNSTVGLSALDHSTPLKVCGVAIYDMEGLTHQGSLDSFWSQSGQSPVSRELYVRFRNYLITNTQLNGSFYRRLDNVESSAGILWTARASARTRDKTSIEQEAAAPIGTDALAAQ